jgi:hypothetical protein
MTRRRAPRPPSEPITRTCQNPKCPRGRTFQTHRSDQLFCSLRCRQATKARARYHRRQAGLVELEELKKKIAELEGKSHREASSNGKADA